MDVEPVIPGDTVSILLKLVGEVCNLDCAYCYERRKPYVGSRLIEPESVAALLAQFPERLLRIELHGGEPLLYPKDRMREIVRLIVNSSNVTGVALQTNGTRLDADWLGLFEPIQDLLEIGISIDGPEQVNSWRLDHRGRPAFGGILRGIALLREKGIRTGLISVITKRSLGQEQALLDLAASFDNVCLLKLVPCFDVGVRQGTGPRRSAATLAAGAMGGTLGDAWSISPHQFLSFLCNAFDLWSEKGYGQHFVLEPFLALTRSLLNLQTDTCSYSTVKCGHVVTLYPGDEIGSCDELDRADAAIGGLGSLGANSTGFAKCRASEQARAQLAKCDACDYRNRCHGGCIATRNRFRAVGREEEYCNYRKGLIDFMSDRIEGARA